MKTAKTDYVARQQKLRASRVAWYDGDTYDLVCMDCADDHGIGRQYGYVPLTARQLEGKCREWDMTAVSCSSCGHTLIDELEAPV